MGIRKAVICPGSRNAPLILAFSRHKGIKSYSIPDERSAAFIALGMATASRETVALICTSGTASLNFYPAIAEAYYREIPLLILTADRPPELIDQWDGQAIHQEDIYDKHIRGSFQAPDDLSEENMGKQLAELTEQAIKLCTGRIPGPVHINLPFREPLYPRTSEIFSYPELDIELEEKETENPDLPSSLLHQLENSSRIMLLAGADIPDERRNEFLRRLYKSGKILVLADIASGSYQSGLARWDLLISSLDNADADKFAPEVLITVGTATVSKKLKEMLRRNKPSSHWHISASGTGADPFFSFPKYHHAEPISFLEKLSEATDMISSGSYVQDWLNLSLQLTEKIAEQKQEFSEIEAVQIILKKLPADSVLHLANSMPVRYASMLGIPENIEVFANRGTSGIDGCSSTALGAALCSGKTNILLTGDVAFFYDVNAFWHPHLPSNLKIILLNNKGGGIFRLIEGPSSQPELAERFETRHSRTAEHVCRDFGIRYHAAKDESSLSAGLYELFAIEGLALLELNTEPETNSSAYKAFRKAVMLTVPDVR